MRNVLILLFLILVTAISFHITLLCYVFMPVDDVILTRNVIRMNQSTVHDTVYVDTCDSQFMKAIMENETRHITKLRKGVNQLPAIGDGGKAIGLFQMHESYFLGCALAETLEYEYKDMFDYKQYHIFWAKMGVYADRFKRLNKRAPTYEELARYHQMPRATNHPAAIRYGKKIKIAMSII